MAEEKKSQSQLFVTSKFVNKIGKETIKSIVKEHFCSDTQIISVGSGNGAFESFYNQNIICVDPHPTKYLRNNQIYTKPLYSYVEELVREKPELIGNSNLMLISPPPGDEITYDIEAIRLLKPKCILIVGEFTGTCSSSQFWGWYEKNVDPDCERGMYGVIADFEDDLEDYGRVYCLEKNAGSVRYFCMVLKQGSNDNECVHKKEHLTHEAEQCFLM